MKPVAVLFVSAAAGAWCACAAEPQAGAERIPSPGGEVILPSAGDRKAYHTYDYAAARRVGDILYVSGVIVGRGPGEGNDIEAFKVQTRRAFQRLQRTLEAAGASFEDVAMLRTFHLWQSPDFTGTRDEQFQAFLAVKREFMRAPHPAWTAVGTTGLLADGGIVEVELIARVPSSTDEPASRPAGR